MSPKGFDMPSMKPVPILTHNISRWDKICQEFAARKWMIDEDYELYVPFLDETLFIPSGFIFDGASIPRFLWPMMSPVGILFLPGLFHDFAYRYNCYMTTDGTLIHQMQGREFFDGNFKKMSEWINDVPSAEIMSWSALRAFGWIAWNKNRKNGETVKVYEDFPELGTRKQEV